MKYYLPLRSRPRSIGQQEIQVRARLYTCLRPNYCTAGVPNVANGLESNLNSLITSLVALYICMCVGTSRKGRNRQAGGKVRTNGSVCITSWLDHGPSRLGRSLKSSLIRDERKRHSQGNTRPAPCWQVSNVSHMVFPGLGWCHCSNEVKAFFITRLTQDASQIFATCLYQFSTCQMLEIVNQDNIHWFRS